MALLVPWACVMWFFCLLPDLSWVVRRAEVDAELVYSGSIEEIHAIPWVRGIRRCALCAGMADIQFMIIQGSCDV
jgi:hypothetical protein